jgi:hypothetical protein
MHSQTIDIITFADLMEDSDVSHTVRHGLAEVHTATHPALGTVVLVISMEPEQYYCISQHPVAALAD